MNEFSFSIPQEILVGRGTAEKLGDAAKNLGMPSSFPGRTSPRWAM